MEHSINWTLVASVLSAITALTNLAYTYKRNLAKDEEDFHSRLLTGKERVDDIDRVRRKAELILRTKLQPIRKVVVSTIKGPNDEELDLEEVYEEGKPIMIFEEQTGNHYVVAYFNIQTKKWAFSKKPTSQWEVTGIGSI